MTELRGGAARGVAAVVVSFNRSAVLAFATGIEHALACGADRLWLFNDNDHAEHGALAAPASLLHAGGVTCQHDQRHPGSEPAFPTQSRRAANWPHPGRH